jgi:hypothetical protein
MGRQRSKPGQNVTETVPPVVEEATGATLTPARRREGARAHVAGYPKSGGRGAEQTRGG